MNGNKSPLEDWIEEGKARKEFKKEIYAEINKVKADLENKIRSCDTKVENLETTVQELRKKVPASQKDLSNSELLEQLKEKDSRILLMGANSKRIITLMKQKLVTKEEKIRQLDKENLNNAKRIKLLEEELSKHSLDLNENFDNAELNDAKVGEVKPANYDGANPIDTKMPEDIKKEFVKDDLSMKNESEVRKDAVVDSVCRPMSEDMDVKDTVIGSLKVSKEEKILRDEESIFDPSRNVEAMENFRDICVGKNGSLKITVAMPSQQMEIDGTAKDDKDSNESSRIDLTDKDVNSDINKGIKRERIEDDNTVTKKSGNIVHEADHDLTCCCCSNNHTNIKSKNSTSDTHEKHEDKTNNDETNKPDENAVDTGDAETIKDVVKDKEMKEQQEKTPVEDTKSDRALEDCGSKKDVLASGSGDQSKELYVRIKVSGLKRTLIYLMKKTVVLKKLMTMYSDRADLPLSQLDFTYLGRPINQYNTPEQLSMKQLAAIHVSTKKSQNK